MGISIYPDWQLGRASFNQKRRARKQRTHRYNQGQLGTEFFLETSADTSVSYMTAQGPVVRPGDYIDIASPDGHLKFQVDEIEYYSDPADMWMAQLYPLAA
ncbi:hypothetical protein HRE53_11445 [Acaryochloris sp. 'Moss Beach']|uniref:hypothetical protein n=1 Tax=Acaryochloris TaxID=155977 RepID=UPI001BB07C71|nr:MULTISPECIES: hypothetical protein [Acaryochloris]QUY42431.1 hypothetical protein I1H34_25160 [Acaryochloris marina S15]UJB71526.1 hypothetical protein HRE53_11445 [Acaryochloris sp. 'Moss Beach']